MTPELVHSIDGRLRLHVPGLDGSPDLPDRLGKRLGKLAEVRANRAAESLVLNFDPADSREVFAVLGGVFPGLDGKARITRPSRRKHAPRTDVTDLVLPMIRRLDFKRFRRHWERTLAEVLRAERKGVLPLGFLALGAAFFVRDLFKKKPVAPSWYEWLWYAYSAAHAEHVEALEAKALRSKRSRG
jgi:hypothetical protein